MNPSDDPALETDYQKWTRIAREKPAGAERKLANLKAIEALVLEISAVLKKDEQDYWERHK